mmetsp:Transcript_89089/g.250835  ORF Transcript_89089/g.250835 Transcript_89089/m.250835 type:complete len:251 (-) Transcript_89089:1530-2282(-)
MRLNRGSACTVKSGSGNRRTPWWGPHAVETSSLLLIIEAGSTFTSRTWVRSPKRRRCARVEGEVCRCWWRPRRRALAACCVERRHRRQVGPTTDRGNAHAGHRAVRRERTVRQVLLLGRAWMQRHVQVRRRKGMPMLLRVRLGHWRHVSSSTWGLRRPRHDHGQRLVWVGLAPHAWWAARVVAGESGQVLTRRHRRRHRAVQGVRHPAGHVGPCRGAAGGRRCLRWRVPVVAAGRQGWHVPPLGPVRGRP